MPDAPDRGHLEYRIKTLEPRTVPRPEMEKLILSDPDWRAWLGKPRYKIRTYIFTDTIDYDDYNRPNIDCGEAIFLANWSLGDRVKVTLEKIGEGCACF